ncbi:MAG: flagellar export chaperone FliS [Candidatus Schekmanbacteria bacterium]|nr:MAG: flagellar export chaperone FliS [Candidatus Schekmanbacteria bacterium]
MTKNASGSQYRVTQISTSNRIKTISLLYEGAINFLNQSKIKMQEHDYKSKGIYLSKASRIVSELSNALDPTVNKELTRELERLYEFINFKILEANMKNNPAFIDESIKILKTIKEGWDKLSEIEENKRKFSDSLDSVNQKGILSLTI